MGTMSDLLKGKAKAKGKGGKRAPVERSDEELLALMDQLFEGSEETEDEETEDMDKGSGHGYGAKRKGADPREELLRRAAMMDEDMEKADEDEEDVE